MEWDLGVVGILTLAGMALAFGLVVQLLVGRGSTPWLWAIASGVFFVAGLLTSEVWFGEATEEELQPNVDGLSFDEVLLIGVLAGIAAVIVARRLTKHQGR